MNQGIIRRPLFDIKFISEHNEYHVVYDTGSRLNNNYLNESVVSMTTQNSLDNDSSAFSIVLAGDTEWDKVLNGNDLMILKVQPNESFQDGSGKVDGVMNDLIMVGLISEVRVEGEYGDDTKMYRITGQSFQKAFMQFELQTIRQAGMSLGEVGWMDYSAEDGQSGFTQALSNKTIAEVFEAMLGRFVDYMEYNFKKGINRDNHYMKQRMSYYLESWGDEEALQNPVPFTSFQGSFNQLLKDISSKPFCEFFFDTFYQGKTEKAELVLRKTPFSKEDWEKLPRHSLHSSQVINESVGVNDLETFSIFNVVPHTSGSETGIMSAVPYYNPEMIGKFGYRMLEVTNQFLGISATGIEGGDDSGEETEGEVVNSEQEELEEIASDDTREQSLIARYSRRLYNWYINNPNFYAGNLTVMGHPDYRIGNRLLYRNAEKNDLWEFYIESVEHTFSYTNGYTTVLGVTRGLRIENKHSFGVRFNPPVGQSEVFKGGYLGELSLSEIEELQRKNQQANMSGDSGGATFVNDGSIVPPVSPGNGTLMTSPFGYRLHPIHGDWRMHNGIDLSRGGGTDIVSMLPGKVDGVRYDGGYGHYVTVDHGTYNGTPLRTLYAHLASTSVSTGQQVSGGQKLGVMGTTGASTGVHLHFETIENGSRVDPEKYVSYPRA